jgi:phage baseplate assembly protein W
MVQINLDILKRSTEREQVKTFSDLKLDLEIGETYLDQINKKQNIQDIKASYNLDAIRNSFISIITTSPGEKILNPKFGINFGDLLFLPVTEPRARVIGENIIQNVTKFEPRMNLINVNVEANEELQEYILDIAYTIPRFNNESFNIKGSLNKSGFTTL